MKVKEIALWKKVSLTYLFLLGSYSVSVAIPSTQDSVIYQAILQGDFDSADQLLTGKTSHDAHYLRCLLTFIRTSISGKPEDYESFEKNSETALKDLDNADEQDLWAKYYHQEILLQQAILLIKFDHEIRAAWRIRQTYKEAKRNLFAHDNFYPFHKTFGILETLIGAVPDNIQWIPGLFGMEGSIFSGLDHLEQVAENEPLLRTEALLLSALVRSYLLEEHQDAVDNFISLWMKRTNSPLITYLGMNIMLRAHKASEAIEMYEMLSPTGKNDIAFLNYLTGIALLQTGNYEESEKRFNVFISIYRGNDFIKDAYYRLFLTQWLQGNETQAKSYFTEIKDKGHTATEADRYAQEQSEVDFPHPVIMKLRLFTDGGAFSEAEKLATKHSSFEFASRSLKTEWEYRKGRLAHLQKNIAPAIDQYNRTILLQENENWYYAPNACLQLGYIYLDEDQRDLAESQFRKVFDYKNYPYQKGIERSAQVALNTYF